MLAKLLKHEWKASWRVPAVLIGILWVTAALAGLTFLSPMWTSELKGLDILLVFVILAFYFMIIAVSVGVTLYMAVRFYKSMFTDEGYLTHTLPVTSHQLLLSKILPMAAWSFLSMAGIVISLLIFGGMAFLFLVEDVHAMADSVALVVTQMKEMLGSSLPGFVASVAAMMLVGIFSGPMMIVGSVSLGQMVGKHKVLGSIGAYFGLTTVIQIVMTVIMLPFMLKMAYVADENVFKVLIPVYWFAAGFSVVYMTGLYFLSEYLIRRKLNLD